MINAAARTVRSPLLWAFLAALAVPTLLWAALPVSSKGQSAEVIQQKINETQAKIQQGQTKSQKLVSQVGKYSRKINAMQGGISKLQNRQLTIQEDLDQKRAKLVRTQKELRFQRARLIKLRARLAHTQKVLSKRLLDLYKADQPDLVSVVINSNGFSDLLERRDFLNKIGEQDKRIVNRVRLAKADATSTAKRLDKLEATQQKVTAAVLAKRNAVASVKQELVDRQDSLKGAKATKAELLDQVKTKLKKDKDHLDELEQASQRIQNQLQNPGFDPGPIRKGTGQLIWPVNGPVTSPFCESRAWESCHPGIDIGVPSGTPIRAADSGTVVLQQGSGVSGGYGNFTCVAHSSSMSTCYAHQSSFAVGSGANVKQGQVIGYVGCTGRCFGDHLHFEVRINGAVANPMNYL